MNKKIYQLAFVATALLATACSDDEVNDIQNKPDSEKEMISFSMSDGTGQTRAGFTTADTRIVARFQSDEKGGSGVRYTKCVLTAIKDNDNSGESYSSVEYSSDGTPRYWDDAFGRKGQLSVYAVAIPDSKVDTKLQGTLVSGNVSSWQTEASPDNTIAWSVTADQSSDIFASEDLVYSNNIQADATLGKNGRYVWDYEKTPQGYPDYTGAATHKDGRMVFTQKAGALDSDAGHFDKGHLVFKHSLSRLTITLEEGEGFDGNKNTAVDFKFTNTGDNIQLNTMNIGGKLDIKEGTWSVTSTGNISKLYQSSNTGGANGTYKAQMLPGYKFYKDDGTESVKNVMQFVIDNNTYYITQAQIFAALNVSENTTGTTPKVPVRTDSGKDYIEMEQGKNYSLKIIVKKTKIADVTATLADWIDVTGETSQNNAHLTFSISADGTACGKDIDLYRLEDDNEGYDADNYTFDYKGQKWWGNYLTDDSHKTQLLHSNITDGKWTTSWFFESNKTYYHFRTVNNGTTIIGNDNTSTYDYFNIAAGPIATTDPHWGAPMTKEGTTTYLKYDESKGYEAFLRPAIGATESQIAIQEVHMMSNIKVVLKTPNNDSKVTLKNGDNKTVVKITRIASTGTVEMGRGVVTPTGEYNGELTMTNPTPYFSNDGLETNEYSYAVVPQALSRDFSSTDDTDYVGIFIQTPDNNQYYVVQQLPKIEAVSVSGGHNVVEHGAINRWYPGHTYKYTFTLTKKGIENITCTLADWIDVEAADKDITLED